MFMSGYILIDCDKLNLLGGATPQSKSGLHQRCLDAMKTGKPIYACNCEYGTGVPSTPIAVMGINESGTLVFTSSILQIRVTSADSVTVVSLLS